MRYFYLESSVAVRILYGQSPSAARWFDEATADSDTRVFSSRLLRTELSRLLRRDGKPLSLCEAVIDYVGLLPIDNAVLAQADAIVPQVRTLDAIHLASLLHSGTDGIMVTHDAGLAEAARLSGLAVLDPVEH